MTSRPAGRRRTAKADRSAFAIERKLRLFLAQVRALHPHFSSPRCVRKKRTMRPCHRSMTSGSGTMWVEARKGQEIIVLAVAEQGADELERVTEVDVIVRRAAQRFGLAQGRREREPARVQRRRKASRRVYPGGPDGGRKARRSPLMPHRISMGDAILNGCAQLGNPSPGRCQGRRQAVAVK